MPEKRDATALTLRAEDRWTKALREIVNVLGPIQFDCRSNNCEGCKAEMAEALRIAKEALGVHP